MALSTEAREELQTKLEGLGLKAIEQLEWVLDNSDKPDALIKAAESVLDRIGFAKRTQHEVSIDGDVGITVEHRFPQQDADAITIERKHYEVLPERNGG